MIIRKVKGTYGNPRASHQCTVLTADTRIGSWYCVVGERSVNMTLERICTGVNVANVPNVEGFTWWRVIETEEDLAKAISHWKQERDNERK